MTVSEHLEENQFGDIQQPAAEVSSGSPAIPDETGETSDQPPWHYHDYSDEPRLRDLPIRLMNLPRLIVLALIRFYQLTFSRGMPANTCRFYPSCSHYGYQAIYKHGAIKGSLMAAWRVLRCNPFNRGGYDPVP